MLFADLMKFGLLVHAVLFSAKTTFVLQFFRFHFQPRIQPRISSFCQLVTN